MFDRKKLTIDKIEELKTLIERSVFANENETKKLELQTSGLIKWNYNPKREFKEGQAALFVFYSAYRNLELLNFIKNNILNDKNEVVVSIHVNHFREASFSPAHRDRKTAMTYLVLLEEAEEGGRLLIENEDVNFKVGELISFEGHTTLHEVTPVIKGKRKTLAIWCRKKLSIM